MNNARKQCTSPALKRCSTPSYQDMIFSTDSCYYEQTVLVASIQKVIEQRLRKK